VLLGVSDVAAFGVTMRGDAEGVADGSGDGDTEGDDVGCAEGEGVAEGEGEGACTIMVTLLLATAVPASSILALYVTACAVESLCEKEATPLPSVVAVLTAVPLAVNVTTVLERGLPLASFSVAVSVKVSLTLTSEGPVRVSGVPMAVLEESAGCATVGLPLDEKAKAGAITNIIRTSAATVVRKVRFMAIVALPQLLCLWC
jgi:hypothetical protein